jgi:hypothetical protein
MLKADKSMAQARRLTKLTGSWQFGLIADFRMSAVMKKIPSAADWPLSGTATRYHATSITLWTPSSLRKDALCPHGIPQSAQEYIPLVSLLTSLGTDICNHTFLLPPFFSFFFQVLFNGSFFHTMAVLVLGLFASLLFT